MTAHLHIDTAYFTALVGLPRARSVLANAGIAPAAGPLPPALDMIDFWRACALNIQTGNDESHGIAAEPVPRGSISVLFTAAKEADDLGGALRRLADAARFIRRDCTIALSRGRGVVRLTIHPNPDPRLPDAALRGEIYAECFAIVLHCAVRWMAGRAIAPVRIRGAASLAGIGHGLLDAMHVPVVRHGDGIAIDYDAADMALPVLAQKYTAWGEAEFGAFVAMLGEEEAPAGDEPAQLAALFARGCFAQDAAAAALGLGVATLRRRLAARGTSFRELSAAYRMARLRELLATDMPLGDIAERLGLSDERSLRRFCAMHFATAPTQLRAGGHCQREDAGLV